MRVAEEDLLGSGTHTSTVQLRLFSASVRPLLLVLRRRDGNNNNNGSKQIDGGCVVWGEVAPRNYRVTSGEGGKGEGQMELFLQELNSLAVPRLVRYS